jgi:hypothetical protein
MKTLALLSLVVLALVVPVPAMAAGNPIDTSLGDLRWGMSAGEVSSFLARKLKADYAEKIKKASSEFSKDQLKRELDSTVSDLKRSLITFSGKSTSWDVSFIEGEFTHGNEESMLVYKDGQSHNFYFFFDDKLWKWYKSFDSRAFGGTNFKKFNKAIDGRFGKGRIKEGVLNDATGKNYQWVEYVTRATRLRAVDNTKFYDKYALIFEDMETARNLKSLRANTISKKSKNNSAVASLSRDYQDDDSDDNVADSITGKDRTKAGETPHTDALKKKKSLFADEEQAESEADYRARQKQEKAQALARQRQAHERRAGSEEAKVLKDIGGEDDDPLQGM